MRIAVVTPYCRETPEVLARCLDSVRNQAVPVDHILVADGCPQDWVEDRDNVSHLVLRRGSNDFGDTPRSLGFMLGVRKDYDILQFLDADNILFPDHMAIVLQCIEATRPDLVIARRAMLRPDGSLLNVCWQEDETLAHVDTSCFVFCRAAFPMGLKWGYIPKQFGFCDDRVFYSMVRNSKLKIRVLPTKTVGYTCLWPAVYALAGEVAPANAKDLHLYAAESRSWWNGLGEAEQQRIVDLLGTAPDFE